MDPQQRKGRLRAASPRRALVRGLLGLVMAGGVTVAGLASAWLVLAPQTRFRLELAASGAMARTVSLGLVAFDPYEGHAGLACNCSTDWEYSCEDPANDYYRRVRSDARLAPLFSLPPHRIATYAAYQDFLRSAIQHGTDNPGPSQGYQLLEMLDDAALGRTFLCRDISKMFAQLVQAAGGYARLVSLVDPGGSGHVVAEAWVEDAGGWVVFDPDYNATFSDASGRPLSALDLHALHRQGRYGEVVAHVGASPHSVYRPALHTALLQHYDSVAFSQRASWVTERLPRWHPDRHPIRTLSSFEGASAAFPDFGVEEKRRDAASLYFVPCRPGGPIAAASRGNDAAGG